MDIRTPWHIAVILGLMLLTSCASPAMTRMEIEYPNCEVSEKASSRNTVIVEVKCAGEKPFTRTFHRK